MKVHFKWICPMLRAHHVTFEMLSWPACLQDLLINYLLPSQAACPCPQDDHLP